MPWNSSWPIGSQSVATNRPTGAQNTTYIEDTMNVDHFWNIGSNEDGHHQFVQSPKFEAGGVPADPTLATGMDGVLYYKKKTSAESPDYQAVLPFFKDGDGTPNVMEMLGIRACAVWTWTGAAITENYTHNASVTRTSQGLYKLTFDTALPSVNYLVFADGIKNKASTVEGLTIRVVDATAVSTVKKTTEVTVVIKSALDQNTVLDPLQAWVVCFGG